MKAIPSLHDIRHRIGNLTHDAWRSMRYAAEQLKPGRMRAKRAEHSDEHRSNFDEWWRHH